MALFSSSKERQLAADTLAQAKAMADKAGMVWEQLDPPTQQQIVESISKYQDNVPGEVAQEIDESQMNFLDPELYDSQKEALAKVSQIGEQGLTSEEMMEREMMLNDVAGQEQSRQKLIQQEMNQRGAGGSGVEAAMRIQSSQSAANNARQNALALDATKNKRALEAIGQQASLAGQIRGQEMTRASAQDQIAQFNAAQRTGAQSSNVQNARNIAQQKANALEKSYGYEADKATGQSNAYTGTSNMLGNQAAAQSQAAASKSAATMGLIGSAMGAGAKAFGPTGSDIRCKENIKPGEEKVEEMLDNLEPYEYDYKNPEIDGEGPQLGVMAQDLEKSELGQDFVVDMEEEDGEDYGNEPKKGIDYEAMAPTIVAAQSKLNKENKNLKQRLERLENMLEIFRGNRGME